MKGVIVDIDGFSAAMIFLILCGCLLGGYAIKTNKDITMKAFDSGYHQCMLPGSTMYKWCK